MSDSLSSTVKMQEFKAVKHLGQNFLQNHKIADLTVESLDIQKGDRVLEIGPGPGILTERIIQKNLSKLTLVELDNKFLNKLKLITLGHYDIVEIRNENILDYLNTGKIEHNKIIGAIPYNITSPLFHKILSLDVLPETIVMIIQLEVANKITNYDAGSNYWNLVTMMYDKQLVAKVPAKDFLPSPKVDSAVIKLQINNANYDIFKNEIGSLFRWSKFLHSFFISPRKKLNKSLYKNVLTQLDIDTNLRPHQLSQSQILEVFRLAVKSGILKTENK